MTFNKKKYALIIVGIFGVLIFVETFFHVSENIKQIFQDNSKFSIILSKDGFTPSNLIIQKNDTVVFTSTRDYSFWPASDKHPAHSEYPEFDARKEILFDSSWEFTFTEIGEWSYHDHLNSTLRGLIIVR